MDDKLFQAFNDISRLCIGELGDVVKNDLITIGRALMPAKGELEEMFPELFERDEEEENQEEDESQEEEENQEEIDPLDPLE